MSKGISDALLAELLGDVGKLHDLIKSLPSSLKETISPTLLELSSILKKSQDLTSLTDEKKLVLQRFADNEKQEIRELIKETIAVELLAMKNALELKEKQLKKSKTPMKVIIISGMVGILCGLVIALFFKNI
jgi:hypothetical protein